MNTKICWSEFEIGNLQNLKVSLPQNEYLLINKHKNNFQLTFQRLTRQYLDHVIKLNITCNGTDGHVPPGIMR